MEGGSQDMEVGRGWLPENPQELQDLLGGPAGTCPPTGLAFDVQTLPRIISQIYFCISCTALMGWKCSALFCFVFSCLMLHGYDFKESVFLLEEKRKDESQLLSHHFVKNVSSHLLMICAIVCICYILTKC